MIDFMAVASAGLVHLAVRGGTGLLHDELQAKGANSARISSSQVQSAADAAGLLHVCPNTGRLGKNTGVEYTGVGIDQNPGRKEHMAGGAVRLIDGNITIELAMVEPNWTGFCSWDHFIVTYSNGRVERWDVGADEKRDSGGNGIPVLLAHNGVPLPTNCDTGDKTRYDESTNSCVCPVGQIEDPTDEDSCVVMASCNTGDKTRYDAPTNSCVCPVGQEEDPTDANSCITPPPGCATPEATQAEKMMCAEMLPQDATYDSSDCTTARWEVEYEVDGDNNIRENCLIPMEVRDSLAAASADSPRPLQINSGNIKGCEMRRIDGFTLGTLADLPECESAQLFGDAGLPAQPADFPAAARLTVVAVASGRARVYFNNNEITPGISSGGGGGGGSSAGLIIGGIAVAGFLAYSLTGGTPEEISWAPQYSVFHNGAGTYYSYGSRWSYQKSGWSAYWETGKAGAGEEWRYGSGVEWTGGIWTASFSGVNIGDESDLDLSLSARKKIRGNAWTLRAGANTDIMADEYGAEFSHRLSAGADYRGGSWTVDFSAGASGDGFQHANVYMAAKRDF